MNKFKAYLILIILILTGCDFRSPQPFETPSWELPLSIPLFNDSITMFEIIDTSGSDLVLDTLNNYSIDTTLTMIYEPCPNISDEDYNPSDICCIENLPDYDPYDASCPMRVFISDEYFSVDGINLDVGIDPIEIEISSSEIDPISENIDITLADITGEEIESGCIPLDFFEFSTDTIYLDQISLSPYNSFEEINIQYLDSINSIIVDDGYISLSVENNLPFIIDKFQLSFTDENDEVWINNEVQGVSSGQTQSDQQNLEDSVVPRTINAIPTIIYSMANSDCYLYLPLSDIEDEISFSDSECAALLLSGVVDSNCNLDIDDE